MTSRQAEPFYRVADVLALFMQMGCELRVAEATVQDDDGNVFNFRYLLRSETGSFVPILDLGDDEHVSKGEIRDWERRLDVTIPMPPAASQPGS